METWFIPNTPCELPPARRVLVLAPHADDEVFGCGGCIALYADAGAEVRILVLSDGGGYLEGADRTIQVTARQEESRQAAQILGAQGVDFGPWQDRTLMSAQDLAARIGDAIHETGAELVFAPSLWEAHPDHRAAAWAALQAQDTLARDTQTAPRLALYEVSAPLRPNCLVDITRALARKRSAMAAFQSELTKQSYDRHIAALNTYRTYSLPAAVEAAEALVLVAPEEAAAWLANYDEAVPPGLARISEAALARATVWGETLQQATTRLDHAVRTLSAALERERGERLALQERFESERCAFDSERQALLEQRQALLKQHHAQEAALETALEAVLSSRAWRVTAPIRFLSERLRRLAGS